MEVMIWIVICCFGFAVMVASVAGLIVGLKDDELRATKEEVKVSSFERFYKANLENRIYGIRRW